MQLLSEDRYALRARAAHEIVVDLASTYGPDVVDRLKGYRTLSPALLRKDRIPPAQTAIDEGWQ
jgi:hypothetical protein